MHDKKTDRNGPSFAKRASEKGFTLLLAALVASITLALGAAIYSIAIRQVELAGIGRDSQFAFYTADAMAECTLFWDIHEQIFATSTPTGDSLSLTCNGIPATVHTVQDSNSFQPGSCTFGVGGGDGGNCTSGGFTFIVPSNFESLTVNVYGAGGGGGGGAMRSFPTANGGDGSAGSGLTVFNSSGGFAALAASWGSGGQGGRASGTPSPASPGANGSPDDGVATNGGPGGPGSNGTDGYGGLGGHGGHMSQTYGPTDLPPGGTALNVSVGRGGAGGTGAYNGSGNGTAGGNGLITVTWAGLSGQWTKSVFTYSLDYNGNCAKVRFTKAAGSGSTITNTIHADGYNVPCAAVYSDPHTLQRSVELHY